MILQNKTGKTPVRLDDTFFKEVLESEAFQKVFVEPLRKQDASRSGKIPSFKQSKKCCLLSLFKS